MENSKKHKKSKLSLIILIITLITLNFIIGGCLSKDANIVAKDIEDNKEIKVGVINFLTGPQAIMGEEVNNVLLLANKLDNQENDLQIKLVIEDSKDNPQIAISAYNKLKLDNVPAIISTGDQVNSALAPLSDYDKIILMMSVVGADTTKAEYAYRMWGTTAADCAQAMGNYTTNELKFKEIGIIYINNIYGESYKNEFKKTIENNNAQLIIEEKYGITDTNMRTQLQKIINKNPQAISIIGFGTTYPIIYKQLRELNYKGIILTDTALSVPYFFDTIGIENLNNTYYISTLFNRNQTRSFEMKEFITKYEKEYGTDASWIGAYVYDTYNLLAESIRECGKTSKEIKQCLDKKQNIKGALGDLKLENQRLKVPILIKKVENNKIRIIKKID